jgi:hypothetical protein
VLFFSSVIFDLEIRESEGNDRKGKPGEMGKECNGAYPVAQDHFNQQPGRAISSFQQANTFRQDFRGGEHFVQTA